MSRATGSFSTYMDNRSAISVGWYLFWHGVWGLIRRRPSILVEAGWYGPKDKLAIFRDPQP